jgi:gamma-glutamyltranspeptidase/glutathione hydrolase
MKGAIAAGHALTARAGARILEEGGNAVDACVAAGFAGWVAESPLTGPGAGGFALIAPNGGAPCVADFFVATPGLGRPELRGAEMHAIDVGFGGDSETTQIFRIGGASCAVPGTTAGLEAVHQAYGRLPWAEVVAPSIELARGGVELSRPQAHLHAILDLILRHTGEGRRLYSRPDGSRLQPGDLLCLPDLAGTLERIAEEGAAALYRGELAAATARTVEEGGGRLTVADLEAYEVIWREPVRVPYLGHEVVSNPPPSSGGILIAYGLALLERVGSGEHGSATAIRALAQVMREQTRVRDDRFADALYAGGLEERLLADDALAAAAERIAQGTWSSEQTPAGGTTHVSAVDADGNAASLSSSTGSGSGVIVPGTGIQLNNMLGEYDLVAGAPAESGHRLTSMMAPTIVLANGRPRLVVGSAGSVRLRGAIMQVIVTVLVHGAGVAAAIDAPRVHVEDEHIHCEGGFDAAELDAVEAWSKHLVRWRRRNLYFGGTNAVEVLPDGGLAAAGDARRGGDGVVVG